MGDSTEKNLKSYRNSELKWFLLANILLMLVTSGELKFDSQDANVFSFISEIISITAVSSCAYILTFIFDSILPPIFKVKLIFWWKKQPSCTIFTDMYRKAIDFLSRKNIPHIIYMNNTYDELQKNLKDATIRIHEMTG